MKSYNLIRFSVALILGLSMQGVYAADVTKKGNFSGKFGWNSSGKTYEMAQNHLYWVGEFTGTFFNDKTGGFMDKAAVSCPGTNNIRLDGQIGSAQGNCIVTDAQGEKAFATWSSKGPFPGAYQGEFTWIGGTGKYAGIKGTNKFSAVISAPTTSGFSIWDATFDLPE